jgi:hypothetical protein
MPDRLLLDTNAVLNATFIPDSWSRRAINVARANSGSFYVGTGTLYEACRAAVAEAERLGKRTNPQPFIERYIDDLRVVQVYADGNCPVPDAIPSHDVVVYRESIAAGAEILTSDAELWLACKEIGAPAAFPLEIIRRHEGHALATTIFGVQPCRDSGLIFFRGYPGSWAGLRGAARFTAMYFPGVLWLYYETSKRGWIAELAGYAPIAVTAEIADGALQTVALSWRFGDRIVLRVADARDPATTEMKKHLPDEVTGNVQIGGHPSGEHNWNGAVYVCVNDDRPIGKDTWKEVIRHRDLTPNPFDSDRLRQSLAARLK